MDFLSIIAGILLLVSVVNLVLIALSNKVNWFDTFTIIIVISFLFHYENRLSDYNAFSKSLIQEYNVSIDKVPSSYKELYIDLKSEIEKEKLERKENENNKSK